MLAVLSIFSGVLVVIITTQPRPNRRAFVAYFILFALAVKGLESLTGFLKKNKAG